MTEPLDVAQKYLAELRFNIIKELTPMYNQGTKITSEARIAEARKIEAYLLEAGK